MQTIGPLFLPCVFMGLPQFQFVSHLFTLWSLLWERKCVESFIESVLVMV